MSHSECETLFEASKALLKTRDLPLERPDFHFRAYVPGQRRFRFEKYWKEEFHSIFGRYMVWVLFSVGAENLAKAACVCNGLVQGKTIPLKYPRYTGSISINEWVDRVIDGNWSDGDPIRATQHNYKTLGNYWRSYLPRLASSEDMLQGKAPSDCNLQVLHRGN